MNNVEKIEGMTCRCTPVLPMIYDDALSYYEAVCKVVAKLNETIRQVNEAIDVVNALPNVVQEQGSSTVNVMSQKAVTEEIHMVESRIDDITPLVGRMDVITPAMVKNALDKGKSIFMLVSNGNKNYVMTEFTNEHNTVADTDFIVGVVSTRTERIVVQQSGTEWVMIVNEIPTAIAQDLSDPSASTVPSTNAVVEGIATADYKVWNVDANFDANEILREYEINNRPFAIKWYSEDFNAYLLFTSVGILDDYDEDIGRHFYVITAELNSGVPGVAFKLMGNPDSMVGSQWEFSFGADTCIIDTEFETPGTAISFLGENGVGNAFVKHEGAVYPITTFNPLLGLCASMVIRNIDGTISLEQVIGNIESNTWTASNYPLTDTRSYLITDNAFPTIILARLDSGFVQVVIEHNGTKYVATPTIKYQTDGVTRVLSLIAYDPVDLKLIVKTQSSGTSWLPTIEIPLQ